MRRVLAILGAICATGLGQVAPVAAQSQEGGLVPLQTGQDSRGWEGVGRLDIVGRGFCTAALIRDDLILTAAHCLYDDDNRQMPVSNFTFQAGLRNGRAEATRGVGRMMAHPAYVPDGPTADVAMVSHDIALLELTQPIRNSRIRPFDIAARPQRGDPVGVVSYGANRMEVASLQEVCEVLGRQAGALVLTCQIEHGSSGAPVFSIGDGVARIVSVVSAMGRSSEGSVALGTSLEEPLTELLAHFTTAGPALPGGTQRMVQVGDRNPTGAKFVRP